MSGAVLPGVLRLALERQHRLELLVARLLGRAAGRVALDDEQLVAVRIVGGAVGELAGQHRHARGSCAAPPSAPRACAPSPGAITSSAMRLPSSTCWLSHSSNGSRTICADELHRVARDQLVLHLALELRIEHLHRQHVVGARPHVLGHDLQAALAHRVEVDEVPDRVVHALAQPGDVGAAVARRDHVDVGLGDQVALGRPGDRPHRALALGEAVGLGLRGDVALAEEGARHRLEAGDGGARNSP